MESDPPPQKPRLVAPPAAGRPDIAKRFSTLTHPQISEHTQKTIPKPPKTIQVNIINEPTVTTKRIANWQHDRENLIAQDSLLPDGKSLPSTFEDWKQAEIRGREMGLILNEPEKKKPWWEKFWNWLLE